MPVRREAAFSLTWPGFTRFPGMARHPFRFVYVQIAPKTGIQNLIMAELVLAAPTPPPLFILTRIPRAAIYVQGLASVRGESGALGVPEVYDALAPSPSNRYVATRSSEVGLGFLDENVLIFDLETGQDCGLINEHGLAPHADRASCDSPALNAFLAANAAQGAPAAELAGYDYRIDPEGAGFSGPAFHWTPDETLLMAYNFPIVITFQGGGAFASLYDDFEFEVDPQSGKVLSMNAGRPRAADPANPFSIDQPTGAISYRSRPLTFSQMGRFGVPRKYSPGASRVSGAVTA